MYFYTITKNSLEKKKSKQNYLQWQLAAESEVPAWEFTPLPGDPLAIDRWSQDCEGSALLH